MQNKQTNPQGFSLLEVLISAILLATAGLGLMKIHIYIEQQLSYAEQSIEALAEAEKKLEWFRSHGAISTSDFSAPTFADIASGQSTADNTSYQLTWTVTNSIINPTANNTDLKHIQITASWSDRFNQKHQVTLKTMLSAYNEFSL